MKRIASAVLGLATAVLFSACGGESDEFPQSAEARSVDTASTPVIGRVEPQGDTTPVAKVAPDACALMFFEADSGLTVDRVDTTVARLRRCDPNRNDFTIDGKIRDDGDWEDRGSNVLYHLQNIAYRFEHVQKAFDALPVLARRELLRRSAPTVAAYVAEYMHPDHLHEWVLNLDWKRDIEPVDPAWYDSTAWAPNRFEKVQMKGSTMKLSKVDLWIRMFWRRRGEMVFNAAKDGVSKHLASNRPPGDR